MKNTKPATFSDVNMSNEISITAIVLAAGLSERMEQFKPLMPLGDQRFIERVV